MAVGGRINFEVDDGKYVGKLGNCEMCKRTKFEGYCSKCEVHICRTCFDNHLIIKSCSDHLFEEAHSNATKRSTIRFELCDEHNHEVKVYCTEHKCCACTECILLHHKSCKWEYILPASEEFQSSGELLRLLEEVQGIEYTLDTYLEEIDKHKETAEALNTDAVSDIESLAKSLVEYVAESKQQVLDDANTRESAHQRRLDKLKEHVQSLRSQAEDILTHFRNEDLLHKRFILAVEAMPKVADIQNELATIDCNNVITNYTFRPSNVLNRMMSNTRPIGRLIENRQIDNGQEDEDDIELKTERERNRSLELELNENKVSKQVQGLSDMKQNYDKVIKEKQTVQQEISTLQSDQQKVVTEKQTLQQEMSTLKADHQNVVKEKQTVQQEMSTLKSDHKNEVSKLVKDLGDMKQNYDKIIKEKQTVQQEISTLQSDHQNVIKEKKDVQQEMASLKSDHLKVVTEKQILQQEMSTLKADHQNVVKEKQTVHQEMSTLKSDHKRVVKENQGLQQDISKLKSKMSPSVRLSCGHENYTGRYNQLIKCDTCDIISGDQPDGTFSTNTGNYWIRMEFTFPNGTQSKLNRNPGQPYTGTTAIGYLIGNEEGKTIMNMMELAFGRKCLFTVDNKGNIQSGVEILKIFPETPYQEYISQVRRQFQERGICNQ